MVLFNEYVAYLDRFTAFLIDTNDIELAIIYYPDMVVISGVYGWINPTQLNLREENELEMDRTHHFTCGNIIHYTCPERKFQQFVDVDRAFQDSSVRILTLPANLNDVRYAFCMDKDVSLDKALLIFKRIFDDYRLKMDTFHTTDINFRYT